ncbi:CBS domain-containing protein [Winogradskyella aurantia]|jgi:CBS domain-containing protein|uniref:Inosine-5-monophosphate dehydrogenase n=1 Tax=Winogradskyella aurantia TaxID=1915063 RepID=A0A265UZG4_9FLAO|nr:CBS domain-containing protein [Winogradskyella aurantia]OZV70714.1 inosine-5-monophosphate dehydrogenase [Winogradskyella aurantia]
MGIKSFQGARKQQGTSVPVALKVRDYMTTSLITFRPEQSVQEVVESLIKYKISGGPVVNDRNELVGIISEGDCLKQLSESRYYNMPLEHDNVEKRMAKEVETIDGNMDVFDAANKFLNSKLRRFPIVENGKLVGQISQKDILKAALQLKGVNWNSSTKKSS